MKKQCSFPSAVCLAAFLASLSGVLSSCVSVPLKAAPDWIFSPPAPDATNTYFVGQSSASSRSAADAMNDATANLVAGIVQYLGVQVSVNSEATAKATLDSYSAEIRQSVATQSSSRVAGFKVKERYVHEDRKTGRVSVYILASYLTADLEKEKARIAAVFRERAEAISKPEAEAAGLAQGGRAYDAVFKYIEAALAASASDVDNASVKVERNLKSARGLVARMRFSASGEAPRAFVGQDFPSPFAFSLLLARGDAAGPDMAPVAGARLLVSYQRRQGTRLVPKTVTATTDSRGAVAFTPPPPDFQGKARLSIAPDFQAALDMLGGFPHKYDVLVSALESDLGALSFELPYTVASKASDQVTALCLVELDAQGVAIVGGAAGNGPAAGGRTQTALAEALVKAGFRLSDSGLAAVGALPAVALLDEAAVCDAARFVAVGAAGSAAAGSGAGNYSRLIYGVVREGTVRQDGKAFIAEARAEIRGLDLASGAVVYRAEIPATAIGSDEGSARAAVLRELGLNAVAKDLLANMP